MNTYSIIPKKNFFVKRFFYSIILSREVKQMNISYQGCILDSGFVTPAKAGVQDRRRKDSHRKLFVLDSGFHRNDEEEKRIPSLPRTGSGDSRFLKKHRLSHEAANHNMSGPPESGT
jgi:hypothetical protein